MSELTVWWASAVYDDATVLYQTKEEAIENAWMNSEENVFPMVEKPEYDVLLIQLAEAKREIEYLRRYGNKDCTAMADEALATEEVE